MLKLVLSSVRHSIGRYIATLVAIIAGVAFFTAVSVVSDGVINSLDGNVDAQFGPVDVAVVPEESDAPLTSAAQPDSIKVPEKTAEDLLALNGVEGGAGVLAAPASFAREGGKAFATSAIGRLWVDDEELNPLAVVDGEAPTSAGEVAVDRGLAEKNDLAAGDEATLLTPAGEQQVTIVGTTRFGDSDAIDSGGTISVAEADAFAWLGNDERAYDSFYLRGSGGDDLVDAADEVVPDGLTAQTGDQFRDDQREQSGQFAQTLKSGLQAFAVLALLVGGFVIYNTFNVIVAQRMRELAVLAAVGATPRQLKRSLRLEGLVLGVAGSVLGVAAGYGLTLALQGILKVTGNSLPGGMTFNVGSTIGGILLGTVITLLSVMSPARRAGRAEPMEAMREAAVESRALGRGRLVVAIAMAVLGVAGMVAGGGLVAVGLGGVFLVGSAFVAAPYLARAGAQVSRPLLHRFGVEGRLAADNSVRNPKRTATTANALLIGVFLVTFVAISGASLRDWIVDEVSDAQSADYLVYSQGGAVDEPLVDTLTAIDGVEEVVPFQRQALSIDGEVATASAGDLARMREVAAIKADEGSLDDLGEGTIAVLDTGGGDVPSVGDTVSVAVPDGEPVDLEVVAVLAANQDTGQTGSIIDAGSFSEIVGTSAPSTAFVDLVDDAGEATDDALVEATERRPDITAVEGNMIGELVSTIMDFLIRAVVGLLLMSVVIALIGIVNTMSLSILERRRELGLLRIIGMTDRRVRRMVRAESVLISLLGTVGGLGLGLLVSLLTVLAINRQSDAAVSTSLPWGQLTLVLVLGVALGILAAVLPARRSTRLEVLDAVSAT